MTTAAQILAVARNELGTAETANGSNPYGRAYGVDRVAWCAQLLWWCFRQAGAPELIHPKTAYTPTLYEWFRGRGRTSGTPQVGSLVFFNWPNDGVNRIQHVGIVESVEAAAIVTIEGNTSTSSQSDGGQVMRRRRARNSSIVGYGHPAYTQALAPTPTPRPAEDDDMTPEESTMLRIVFQQLTGTDKLGVPLPGWPSWGGGTGEALTLVDYARRANVETRQVHGNLGSIHTKIDALAGEVAKVKTGAAAAPAASGPPVLTDADVARIAAAVLDLLAKRTAS